MKTSRIAIFATGKGSNADKIIRYFKEHKSIHISLICTNKPDAGVIAIAQAHEIPVQIFSRHDLYESDNLLESLHQHGITHIVLAGFLWLLPHSLISSYENKIVNIHPALLPQYGGKGMYGIHVHQAIKNAGEKETGITIHLVNEKYDEGEFLAQHKIPLTGNETVNEIADKVQLLEHEYYPRAIENWIRSIGPD